MNARNPDDGSRSSPSGHEVRSAETRSRMVGAAIEVFGRVGYEAASTRELAKLGKTNLSAIPYHFGGKRELYLAAAQVIADYARELVDTLVVRLDNPSTGSAIERLEDALAGFVQIMLGDSEPQSWTAFLARCVAEDDDAFRLIYDYALAPFQRSLERVVEVIAQGSLASGEIRLRVSSTIAALISFRLLRGIMLRGMKWKKVPPGKSQQIEQMVQDLVHSGFFSGRDAGGRAGASKRRKNGDK